jgi:hypothetical protein
MGQLGEQMVGSVKFGKNGGAGTRVKPQAPTLRAWTLSLYWQRNTLAGGSSIQNQFN